MAGTLRALDSSLDNPAGCKPWARTAGRWRSLPALQPLCFLLDRSTLPCRGSIGTTGLFPRRGAFAGCSSKAYWTCYRPRAMMNKRHTQPFIARSNRRALRLHEEHTCAITNAYLSITKPWNTAFVTRNFWQKTRSESRLYRYRSEYTTPFSHFFFQ